MHRWQDEQNRDASEGVVSFGKRAAGRGTPASRSDPSKIGRGGQANWAGGQILGP